LVVLTDGRLGVLDFGSLPGAARRPDPGLPSILGRPAQS
jgi:hypothetical protein